MNPDVQGLVGAVAGGVSLLGFVPYVVEIVQRKTRPNRATWWIWTVVGAMLCASYYASGARNTLWVAVSYVAGPLVTAILSIKYGEGGWGRFDRTCLLACACSVVIWWLLRSPMVALMVNLVIDFSGALPTIRKSYREPWTESLLSWVIFLVANAFNVCAIGPLSVATALYPLYLLLLSCLLVALLARPPRTRVASRAQA